MTSALTAPPTLGSLVIGAEPCDAGIDADHVRALLAHQQHTEQLTIGFPGNLNFDYSEFAGLLGVLLNNVGDPESPDSSDVGTKLYEQEVIDFLAELFGARPSQVYGYVTSSGTAASEFGIYTGRQRLPQAALFYSSQAHYTIPLIAEKLRIRAVEVPCGPDGGMNPAALDAACASRRGDGAIVVATVGTTMTGASDHVAVLRRAAAAAGEVHTHVDGALGGLVAAVTDELPDCGFAAGADSIAVSGHKLIGAPMPCGVALARAAHVMPTRTGAYTAATNHTLGCSRSGLAALLLWVALRRRGRSGLAAMVAGCLDAAEYARRRLDELGWRPHRYPGSLIITFDSPPPHVCRRWRLPAVGGRAHLVAVEHVTRARLEAFFQDLTGPAPTADGGEAV